MRRGHIVTAIVALAVGVLGSPVDSADAGTFSRADAFTLAAPSGMRVQVAPRTSQDLASRSVASGVESRARFAARPHTEELVYDVRLAGVAGVRLVGNTVEFLDREGAPRLRMAPPYAAGADGVRVTPNVAVGSCAVDRDPRAPWGRGPTPPGSDSCRVRLDWSAAEISYPAVVAQRWTTGDAMVVPVYDHTENRLSDSRIVVIGGVDTSSGTPVSSNATQIFDPDSRSWAAAPSIPGDDNAGARDQHTATSRFYESIVVAGGFRRDGTTATPLSSVFLFEPAGSWWRPLPAMAEARGGHSAVRLDLPAAERIVVAGGTGAGGPLTTAERFDFLAYAWTTSRLSQPRTRHVATVLTDKRMLLTGGTAGGASLATTDLYDPATDTWRAGPPMTVARSDHAAVPLIDSTVMVSGGRDARGLPTTSVEVYDPGQNQWSTKADLRTARYDHGTAAMSDGTVVVAAGTRTRPLSVVERYDPIADSWSWLGRLRTARTGATLTGYPGSVVLVGGSDTGGAAVGTSEHLQVERSYRTSWVGETLLPEDSAMFPEPVGGLPELFKPRFVQNRVTAMWVDPVPGPDGAVTLYTNTPAEEGYRTHAVYRYEPSRGAFRPITSLVPHGKAGGHAIVSDDRYLYASFFNKDNQGCVRRYLRSDIREAEQAPPTPWEPAAGGDAAGDLCFPEASENTDTRGSGLRGLAVSDRHLFVAHRGDDTIRVYDKSNVAVPLSVTPVPDPAGMVFHGGSLWTIVTGSLPGMPQPPYVREYRVIGTALVPGRTISGADFVPTSLAIHPSGLLAATNDHESSQQVQFFDPARAELPEVTGKRLGEPGGVVAAHGAYGPTRLDGPNAVGFDNAGNAYVSSLGTAVDVWDSQADVRRFDPAGTLDGIMVSHPYQDIVAADPRDPAVVYSAANEYRLDLDSRTPPGQEWAPERTARTVDRFACPQDNRLMGPGANAPLAVRHLGDPSRKYLYASGTGSQYLSVYRFDATGAIARPYFVIGRDPGPDSWPGTQSNRANWVWRDHDGDCQFDAGEFDDWPNTGPGTWWNWSVADNGDLWAVANKGNPILRLRSLNPGGEPRYDSQARDNFGLPAPFKAGEIIRIEYVSATDTLYAFGRDNLDLDKATGWKLARYDHFARDHATATPTWVTDLHDEAERCRGMDPAQRAYHECINMLIPAGLAVGGDRVYVSAGGEPYPVASLGRIRAYDAATGELRTVLAPGPEVGYRSGWLDQVPYTISATQLPDGRRLLFAEEVYTGRILLYRDF